METSGAPDLKQIEKQDTDSERTRSAEDESASDTMTADRSAKSSGGKPSAQTKHSISPEVGEQLSRWFSLSEDSMRFIKNAIGRELELGLRDEDAATIKMLITYVRELSRGDETGSYLALDLGGTHFRVLLVTLMGDGSDPKVVSVTHDIPQAMLVTQNGQELFDYIAIKLLEFVQYHKLKRRRISLGFTFSFPCKQYGLTQSILVKWCKGFNVGGVVGTDVVKQLKNALKRQLAGLVEAYIDVVAVINDTTGTLVACANKHRDCRVGLIVGTGFNACYMEQLDKCEKWPANYTSPKRVIINCEWGAMGDNQERRELDKFRNEFDVRICKESVNASNQTYEKMVSGMYVGELLRLCMLKLMGARQLFCGSTGSCDSGTSPAARQTSVSMSQVKSESSLLGVESQSSKSGRSVSKSNSPSVSSNSSSANNSNKTAKSPSATPARSPRAAAPKSPSNNKEADGQHRLHVKDVLNGKHLSMLALDEQTGKFTETIKIMKELNVSNYTDQDLAIVVRIGAAIMRRSASLVACGVSALLERVRRPFTVIGYDGSVIKHHPYFLRLLIERTHLLTPREFKFEFAQSSDGSGIGAAVVAAALHKERRPLYVVKPGKLYEMHYARNPQSQLSFEGTAQAQTGAQQQATGLERAGSVSSRASSSASSASTASSASSASSASLSTASSPRK